MSLLKNLENTVLSLPEKDRMRLAPPLLGTLPAPIAESSADILVEAGRRDAELECGRVRPLTEVQFWVGVRRRLR